MQDRPGNDYDIFMCNGKTARDDLNKFKNTVHIEHLHKIGKTEETEEAILEMLRDMVNKIKVEIENEKKDR